jgi:hypothetical protein
MVERRGGLKGSSVSKSAQWDQCDAVARAGAALLLLHREGISLPAAIALIWIAGVTMQKDNPRVPNISDIQQVLGLKTLSGASRLLANLADTEGPALVMSDRGVRGARSEAYFLTAKGRELVGRVVSVLTDGAVTEIDAYALSTFAQARFVDGIESKSLCKTDEDDEGLTLKVTVPDEATLVEMKSWTQEFLQGAARVTVENRCVTITFSDLADAVYFKLRWC